MRYKTRWNRSPQGKEKVFFCCSQADFEKVFEEITEDILKEQDVVIWYYENAEQKSTNIDEYEEQLSQMQLVVIPVSHLLLEQSNFVTDIVIPVVKKHHIPVLPIVIENDIGKEFVHIFGDIQFLDKYKKNNGEIPYRKKLCDFLEKVLVGDELSKKIRSAFNFYMFLSYRKKDRKHAQELMRFIHAHEFCRDIAIWYDEYLVPGENFNDVIMEALDKSKIFLLAVTPNLLEEGNYVMKYEYPKAIEENKLIFPVELMDTDKSELDKYFHNIPECLNINDGSKLAKNLSNIFRKIDIKSKKSAEYDYLMGLAYLNGIDVEINKEMAITLISKSAKNNFPDAIEKLVEMYEYGINVERQYNKAIEWQKKLVAHYLYYEGEKGLKLSESVRKVGCLYEELGNLDKAVSYYKIAYKRNVKLFGKDHFFSIRIAGSIEMISDKKEERERYKEMLNYEMQHFDNMCDLLGAYHPQTLKAANNLAVLVGKTNHHEDAIEMLETIYDAECKELEEEDPIALFTLSLMSNEYEIISKYEKALEIKKKEYDIRTENLGRKHRTSIKSLSEMASLYTNMGKYKEALAAYEAVYELQCETIGEKHPDTSHTIASIGILYMHLQNIEKAAEFLNRANELDKELKEDKVDICNGKGSLKIVK